jgi:hypothetical protein
MGYRTPKVPTVQDQEEQALLLEVLRIVKARNLLWFHDFDSRKNPPGLPDLIIVGPGGILYAELKSEHGPTSMMQTRWLRALLAQRQQAVIWRPSDLRTGKIEKLISGCGSWATAPSTSGSRTAPSGTRG